MSKFLIIGYFQNHLGVPIFRIISLLRLTWKLEQAKHPIIYYFDLVAYNVFALMPFVYYKTVHTNLDKMQHLLDVISNNSLLTQSGNFTFRKGVCYAKTILVF